MFHELSKFILCGSGGQVILVRDNYTMVTTIAVKRQRMLMSTQLDSTRLDIQHVV